VQPDRIIRQTIENLKVSHPELLEDDEAWAATLESETDFNEVLTTIVRRIEDTKALVIGTKDRFEELKARKDRFEHRVETLRELAFKIMAAAELAKVELPEATLSLRAGTQQLVGEADPATLPDSLCKISRSPDRTAIKEALKEGKTVPGFLLSNSQPSLTIRIK
jgi:nitrogen fixation/metabolism regulation signal transduction histidine kinase